MKPQYFKHFFVALVLLCGVSAFSQTELKNSVLDAETFLPLESASVYVKNTTIGTITNADGKFVLVVPDRYNLDTLVVSSIGFKSYKIPVNEFDSTFDVYLEPDVASLDEILLVADTRPKTGNDIVLRALERLSENLPDSAYIEKGFVRHKERNKKEFKWLVEGAITLYDSSYQTNTSEFLKINVDEVRKSYDLRDVDSLLTYTAYLKDKSNNRDLKARNLRRDTIKTSSLIKAIKWNDTRINGLENFFQGKLNLVRNSNKSRALFSENMLEQHLFSLDTILVDNDRKIYKIKINKGKEYINLETKGIYNDGYNANGWIYIYWDTYAIKKIEYELIAASSAQKSRSKTLFGTQVNHKLIINYMEYQDKMYPSYIYYETPKLVNVGSKVGSNLKGEEVESNPEERYYYTVQEILFTEIILDKEKIKEALNSTWDPDIFMSRPYNKAFWKDYNTLLESEEEEKLIQDLTKRSSLFKE
ncbi:carboxypeptidase-like regulatory domain-containing protein [Xanthomarina sp. F2636L]|uniref:carboxypeptidase-like regulatory domain-containing protein n=1 Tax=Xanthomarina sp. F2636L TaxID=2996018 RepID=UPI00225DF989|nr:carboxypeptidase-like regulatory domain-containing protein [Xanthomarina sp. F2636L]MCX7550586.1 carboxypeptidase-like regulatory domain-containing protein [Xanthomarina sp. F2636L]